MSRSYFAQVAEQWDALRASMYSDAVRDAALAKAALHPTAVAVDIGAGTGFLTTRGLAARVARVYAVDNAPQMLEVARRKLTGFNNIEFQVADGSNLPLRDGSVDAVLANMYLHHMPDPLAAIREMARLLKPGGRLVITDLDQHPYTWLREEEHDIWLGFERRQVQAWFEAAGLVNVLVEDSGQVCRCESQTERGPAAVSIFVAVGTRPEPRMAQAVQSHYRQVALGGSNCCGPAPADCCSPLSVPGAADCCAPAAAEDATEATLSLGCGNPVALAGLRPGQVVLDVGSGAGADVFPAAQRVGPTGRVIGVDLLPEMLERARRTSQAYGYTNVEFRQGDALGLPVGDETVDVVMSNCVINLVQDKGRAFREAYRVLKPGGQLVISDIVTDRPFSPAVRQDAESWAACISGALSEAEYLALIAQAGFADIKVTRSQSWRAEDGTRVYSVHISAMKSTCGEGDSLHSRNTE